MLRFASLVASLLLYSPLLVASKDPSECPNVPCLDFYQPGRVEPRSGNRPPSGGGNCYCSDKAKTMSNTQWYYDD